MGKNNLQDKLIDTSADIDNDKTGFVLGTVSVVLLFMCVAVLLLFNNTQVRRIINKRINVDALIKPSNISTESNNSKIRLTEINLNIKAEHPNGTVGKITNISFHKNKTIVEMAITNGFQHTISLNLHGKGLVIIDNLGDEYNFKPYFFNSDFEIKSGETFKGSLRFEGRVNPNAKSLTLITNSKIGSDQLFTRRPKIQFNIPLNQENKDEQ